MSIITNIPIEVWAFLAGMSAVRFYDWFKSGWKTWERS